MAKAKQLIISVADRPGAVADAIRAFQGAKVNILAIVAWNPSGVLQIVTDNPRAAKKALDAVQVQYTEAGAEIVDLPNKPGTLLQYLDKLAKKNVNLRVLYAAASKAARKATVVWAPES